MKSSTRTTSVNRARCPRPSKSWTEPKESHRNYSPIAWLCGNWHWVFITVMSITAIIGFAAVIEAGMRHRELTDIYEQRDLDASVRFAKMEALEGNTPLFEFAFAWMYAVCFGTLGVWLSVGIVWGIRGDC